MGRSATAFALLMAAVASATTPTTPPSPPPPDMTPVQIFMEPCLADPYVGLQCMVISKPFYFLFVHGFCVDNLSQEQVRTSHASGTGGRTCLAWTRDTTLPTSRSRRSPRVSTACTSTRPGTARATASGSTTTGAGSASHSLLRSATTTWAWATRTPRRPPTARKRPVRRPPAPSMPPDCFARLLHSSPPDALRACPRPSLAPTRPRPVPSRR